jgi:hypothetical protein
VCSKGRDLCKTSLRAKAGFVVAVALEKPMLHGLLQHDNRQIERCARGAMRRILVWIDEQRFQGWGCSECEWVFNPSGPPTGKSLDEMKQNYEHQRDKEFADHVCDKHPGDKGQKVK